MLVIRFSSMGDVLLITPILRALKTEMPQLQLHVLVKPQFQQVLANNPYIDVLHSWQPGIRATLQRERFSKVIDLQNSLRSLSLRLSLGRPSRVVNKKNSVKWLMVSAKLPLRVSHIVSRYAATIRPLQLDQQGLDFTIPVEQVAEADSLLLAAQITSPPIVVALGAAHNTKKWPIAYFEELLQRISLPVVLLGGAAEQAEATELASRMGTPCLNLAGKTSLALSAALVQRGRCLITHDTGLMHLGAAVGQRLFTIWGNTVPQFGMTPYKAEHFISEIKPLDCRPCSKIGFDACPMGHFRCMRDNTPARVFAQLQQTGYLLAGEVNAQQEVKNDLEYRQAQQ